MQGLRPALCKRDEGLVDVAIGGGGQHMQIKAKRARRHLGIFHLGGGVRVVRVRQHGDGGSSGQELAEQSDPLAADPVAEDGHAGNVAARTIEARDIAGSDRIAVDHEGDRDGRGRGLGGPERRRIISEDQCRLPTRELARQRRQADDIAQTNGAR